ncbi:MAG: kelch repeat-containing protein [Leeuwenhoekiella sp.]
MKVKTLNATVQTWLILLMLFCYKGITAQTLTSYSWILLEASGEPSKRHENAFVEFDGKFYLLGGRGINPVNVFDPETNTWSSNRPTPFEIHHYQPVVYGDAIWIVGAMTGSYPKETPLENIWKYYPKTDTWEKGPEIPIDRRRGGAGAVVYQDKFYLVCGIDFGHTSGTNNLFDCYDPKNNTWKTLTKAPTIRDHFSAIVVNDKLYCIGGRNTSYHEPENFSAFFGATNPYVDVYDFEKGQWTTLPEQFPKPAAAPAVVQLGDVIIIAGGESDQPKAHEETWSFDPQTGNFTLLAPMATGRHGSHAVNYKGALYIAAGSPVKGGGNLNTIERFSKTK